MIKSLKPSSPHPLSNLLIKNPFDKNLAIHSKIAYSSSSQTLNHLLIKYPSDKNVAIYNKIAYQIPTSPV